MFHIPTDSKTCSLCKRIATAAQVGLLALPALSSGALAQTISENKPRVSPSQILLRSQQYLGATATRSAKKSDPVTDELRQFLDWSTADSLNIWVFFADKGAQAEALLRAPNNKRLTPRALHRRAKVNKSRTIFADLPVNGAYVNSVSAFGVTERARSRWLNAGAFTVARSDISAISKIAALSFVIEIRPAVTYKRRSPGNTETLKRGQLHGDPAVMQPNSADLLNYGNSAAQLFQLNAQVGHQQGYDGAGVTIAMFDTGYRKTHSAFEAIIAQGRLLAEWDFINGDSNTANEIGDPGGSWNHGTLTWSTAGGRADGIHFGPAFGANFLLAKTENIASETIQEEFDWVSALEWADSIGADVVSSSLAYADWYQQSDYDGATAVTTVAANMAAAMGIVVCNAAANSGPAPSTLNAPADAHDILTCGAVDPNGVLASFSSRGPTADGRIKPDVCARGVSTFSASANSDSQFGQASGTSLSTPLIAGVTAQLIQARPTYPPVLIMRALRETADHANTPDNNYGWGIIDLAAALRWGVNFLADSSNSDLIVVDHPATIEFADNSDLAAGAWNWSFGDGTSSTEANPTHTYAAPGTYDVDLAIQTAYGSFNKTRNNLVVVRADTVVLAPDSAYAGHDLAVRVNLTNSQPLKFFRVPLDYSGPLNLVFDSVTTGARTTGFSLNVTGRDPFNKTVTAQALANSVNLPAGSGESMVFHFTVGPTTLGGVTGVVSQTLTPGELAVVTDEVSFPPLFVNAAYSTRHILRGDVDSNERINIADAVYLIDYLFSDGAEPLTLQSGDADANLLENLADAMYLVNYIFKNGPAPPTP